jgi:hypothetical protein
MESASHFEPVRAESRHRRLFGIQLIAAFFLVKTAVFGGALLAAHLDLRIRVAAIELIRQLAPLLQLTRPQVVLAVAPLFLILGMVIVPGVWFLQGWAWVLLFVDRGTSLIDLAQFLGFSALFNGGRLPLLPSSPYFAVDIVSSMFIVVYLLRPEVRRAFGDTTT